MKLLLVALLLSSFHPGHSFAVQQSPSAVDSGSSGEDLIDPFSAVEQDHETGSEKNVDCTGLNLGSCIYFSRFQFFYKATNLSQEEEYLDAMPEEYLSDCQLFNLLGDCFPKLSKSCRAANDSLLSEMMSSYQTGLQNMCKDDGKSSGNVDCTDEHVKYCLDHSLFILMYKEIYLFGMLEETKSYCQLFNLFEDCYTKLSRSCLGANETISSLMSSLQRLLQGVCKDDSKIFESVGTCMRDNQHFSFECLLWEGEEHVAKDEVVEAFSFCQDIDEFECLANKTRHYCANSEEYSQLLEDFVKSLKHDVCEKRKDLSTLLEGDTLH